VESKRYRLRTPLAVILVALACLAGLTTAIGFWTHSLLLDTDDFVGVVGPVLKDKAVTRTVGTYVADKTVEIARVEALIRRALPERIGFLAGPLTGQVRDQVRSGMIKALRSDAVYDLWIDINRFAHEQAVALLRGQTKTVRIEGDKVVLDVVPLIAIGIKHLDRIIPGVIGERVELPSIDPTASPDQQRRQLAETLGRPVSPGFGTVVLLHSDKVRTAQTAVKVFDVLIWVLLGVAALFAGAAVAVSPRRRRTLVQLGIGAALMVVLVFVIMAQLKGWVVNSIPVEGLVPLVSHSVEQLVTSLRHVLVWMLAAGFAVAVAGYLAGAPRWLMNLAGWVNRTARAGASGAARIRGPVATWFAVHSTGLQASGLVVAIAILFFVSGSLGGSVAAIALLAVWEIAVLVVGSRRPSGPPGHED
jgi:hypothetical protein